MYISIYFLYKKFILCEIKKRQVLSNLTIPILLYTYIRILGAAVELLLLGMQLTMHLTKLMAYTSMDYGVVSFSIF